MPVSKPQKTKANKTKKSPKSKPKLQTAVQEKTKTKVHPMDTLLQKKQIPYLKKGTEIEARIITLSRKGIVFDVGAKAYAALGTREVKELSTYLPYLKEEQVVPVRVISEESKEGFPVVSMQRFFDRGKWEILHEKKEKEEGIEVVCGDYGKGGVFIDFMGIRGVIPKIQLTHDYIDHPEKLARQKIKVKVLEVDQEKNRLVVSQKAAALGISRKDLKNKFDKIKEGKVYKAKVLGTSEFGIFCEVNGVEGLIHISEISWEKVTDVSSFALPESEIEVMVVEKNKSDFKLNLSIKRLSHDPWKDIEKRYPKDKEVEGEIVRRERYGYFVRLEPGVEGLIHISKLAKEDEFEVGKKVKAYIERINERSRRLSLVLPQKEKPIFYR